MRILLIGSGSREHAIAKAIKRSATKTELYCLSTAVNPGIKRLSVAYKIFSITDVNSITSYAKAQNINLVIVGPEAPLEAGVVDALEYNNIATIGPAKNHAKIETSKGFARDLLEKYAIGGNPSFKRFSSMDGVMETLRAYEQRFVIKADGLCGGKGVVVWQDHIHSMDQALAHCKNLVEQGTEFVIEEKVEGEEFSLISFSDGKSLVHTPLIQDHKRAYVGDTGPNTGGMGTYSDVDHSLPFLSEQDRQTAEKINEAVIDALYQQYQTPYKGILYGGFMATKDSVKVIEYNARFGDPEAINILHLLESDFVDILKAIVSETLDSMTVQFKRQASVCKYMVPKGYPDNPDKGFAVDIGDVGSDVDIFMGSVDEKAGKLIGTGSRTVALLALADTLVQAEKNVENATRNIGGNLFHRPDIGTQKLIDKRILHMQSLRNGAGV